MIRFEVTGATPEEFAENAMKAWGLLAIGLQAALQPRTDGLANLLGEMQDAEVMSGSESSSTASKEITATTTNPAKVHSDPVDDLWKATSLENQPPASSASAVAPSKSKTKGPKLDDLKTRLSEVIVAATERWDQKRANAYARTLLKRMGAEKLSELEPEKYDEFMIMSALYLSGSAAE